MKTSSHGMSAGMKELNVPLTVEELRKAIGYLSTRKAPGLDSIPKQDVKAQTASCFPIYTAICT